VQVLKFWHFLPAIQSESQNIPFDRCACVTLMSHLSSRLLDISFEKQKEAFVPVIVVTAQNEQPKYFLHVILSVQRLHRSSGMLINVTWLLIPPSKPPTT
jgi:hypothetical protein